MRANKRLGQNFLTSTDVLAKIIETADLAGDETVVEVGGGDGFLTRGLENQMYNSKLIMQNEKRGQILVLEFDYRLVEKLRGEFKNSKVVKIIHQDALKFDWEGLPKNYKIVANIPYQITSPLLNLWTFQLNNQPQSLTIMVQKEVAERLTAPPGSAKRGLTTVLVELYGAATYIKTVPAQAFFPVPKVDSAIIHIVPNSKSQTLNSKQIQNNKHQNSKQAIVAIAKAGFSAKRRTLLNGLSGALSLSKMQVDAILKQAGIENSRRAETLSVTEWVTLANVIKSKFNK